MNKKGFTLIELLAVILILGIIALIAIPQVTKIIEESKRGAFKTTIQNLMDAVEKRCTVDMLKEENSSQTYIINNGKIQPSVDIKGDLPSNGNIVVSNECQVTEVNITEDDYAFKLVNDEIVTKKITETPGFVIYYNPVENKVCNDYKEENSLTSVKTGCMKWYVVETKDNSDDAIDVILDHNTTAVLKYNSDGKVYNYETSLIKVEVDKLDDTIESGGAGWNEGLKPRLLSGHEVAAITGADKEDTIKWSVKTKKFNDNPPSNVDASSSWFYLDGMKNSNNKSYSNVDGWQKQWAGTVDNNGNKLNGTSDFYWLYDYTASSDSLDSNNKNFTQMCTDYGCKKGANDNGGYWLEAYIASDTDGRGLGIDGMGKLSGKSGTIGSKYGLRPVISIPKSKLQ